MTRFYWRITAMLWMSLMWLLSTSRFRSDKSLKIMEGSMFYLFGASAPAETVVELLNELVRKSAHVAEYAVLGALLYFALQPSNRSFIVWDRSVALRAFSIAAVFAVLDEIHQSYVPGRGPSPVDVAIDCIGVALSIFMILHRLKARPWSKTHKQS
jgi:VanZ family protein